MRKLPQAAWLLWMGLVFFSTQDSSADDFILKSGEVIEGKVDRTATLAENKNVAQKNDAVVVVTIDEAGRQRTFKQSDIKHRVEKKSSWEVLKENLKWYDENLPKQKETIADMESFGRQCHSRRLGRQALLALGRAYDLKNEALAAKARRSPEDHIALAAWARKNALLPEESDQIKSALKIKHDEAEAAGGTAKALLDLAQWCIRQKLEDETLKSYEQVIAVDPNNSMAMGAIRSIKEAPAYKLRALTEEYAASGRAWKLKVAIEDGVSASVVKEWKTKLEELSTFIFEITEGQFFVSEWTLEDQCSDGDVLVEKGKLDWSLIGQKEVSKSGETIAYCVSTTGSDGSTSWQVHAPGKIQDVALCHELFHGIFRLGDEYLQNTPCDCIMGKGPHPQRLCNAKAHIAGDRQVASCIDSIMARSHDVVFPNPAWRFTKEGVSGTDPNLGERVDGELTWRGLKLTKPPVCKVIVIGK